MKEKIPKKLCSHCYPDCTITNYRTSLTYADFPGCDSKTLGGANRLCSILNGPVNPAPWMNFAQEEYRRLNANVPWYLSTTGQASDNHKYHKKFSNRRTWLTETNEVESTEMFPDAVRKNPYYDAYEKDIALIAIYFSEETTESFTTKNSMTLNDFMADIGGSLGFIMGLSIFSIIELIYWFVFRLFFRVFK